MVGVSGTSKSGSSYYYYKCSGQTHGKKNCDSHSIRRDIIENAVYEATVSMLKQPQAVKIITEQAILAQERCRDDSEVLRLKRKRRSGCENTKYFKGRGCRTYR